jgi:hypothetical protein
MSVISSTSSRSAPCAAKSRAFLARFVGGLLEANCYSLRIDHLGRRRYRQKGQIVQSDAARITPSVTCATHLRIGRMHNFVIDQAPHKIRTPH